ncbi:MULTISPECIES: hypothetical protein [unclassified Spirillospora]|uniref:hypothetical protein n=1 Tax=unclassified Spirillospora TaxID=2642701 RepID=UPI00371BB993
MGGQRTVVVVGGGSGLGAATAALLRSHGEFVVVADLPGTGADVQVDVTDEGGVEALFGGRCARVRATPCARQRSGARPGRHTADGAGDGHTPGERGAHLMRYPDLAGLVEKAFT